MKFVAILVLSFPTIVSCRRSNRIHRTSLALSNAFGSPDLVSKLSRIRFRILDISHSVSASLVLTQPCGLLMLIPSEPKFNQPEWYFLKTTKALTPNGALAVEPVIGQRRVSQEAGSNTCLLSRS
jgi:hypothetical protein